MTASAPPKTPLDRLRALKIWLMHDVPGGAGVLRPRHVINLHKLSVGPLTLALMFAYDNFTLAAWLYLALHGTYGILWVAKDIAYGDPNWTKPCSLASGVLIFFFPLSFYYAAPLVLLTPLGSVIPGAYGDAASLSSPLAFASVTCFIIGAFFHFVSDAQKYYVLKHERPRRLITDGMFALTRNPNYFGEILIYASFNLLAQHALPWLLCAIVWLSVFLLNMLHKERSMARYPEHAEWVKRTGFLVPSLVGMLRRLPRAFRG